MNRSNNNSRSSYNKNNFSSLEGLRYEEERYMRMLQLYNKTGSPDLWRRIQDLFSSLCQAWDKVANKRR